MPRRAHNYQLRFEDCPGYLYAYVSTKQVDVTTAVDYMTHAIDRCRKGHYNRLMIDRDIPMTLSDPDTFFATREVIALGLDRMKIALVDNRAENKKGLEFVQLTAGNRGANIRYFPNRPSAEQWLTNS